MTEDRISGREEGAGLPIQAEHGDKTDKNKSEQSSRGLTDDDEGWPCGPPESDKDRRN